MTPGELLCRATWREVVEMVEFDALEVLATREDFMTFFGDLIAKVHNASGNYKTTLRPEDVYRKPDARGDSEADRKNRSRFYAVWRLAQLRASVKRGRRRTADAGTGGGPGGGEPPAP